LTAGLNWQKERGREELKKKNFLITTKVAPLLPKKIGEKIVSEETPVLNRS